MTLLPAPLVPFQSTLPARGATASWPQSSPSKRYFNPRSLHGERRFIIVSPPADRHISIHAPCTGSDMMAQRGTGSRYRFQSTLPARGATTQQRRAALIRTISIHAPCTGSDSTLDEFKAFLDAFQSTLPARGATRRNTPRFYPKDFNPRSLHGERLTKLKRQLANFYFNPRSLHGERRFVSFTL